MSDSPSPAMMNSAFRHLGLDSTYEIINVPPDGLVHAFATLVRERASGMNVTAPHKSAICPLLGSMDDLSRRTGAVNTIKKQGDDYAGFNTDVEGITTPLSSRGVTHLDRAVAVGTGGAARAFCAAMDRLHCRELTLISRRPSDRQGFLESVRDSFPEMKIDICSTTDQPVNDPDLVFNASPSGMTFAGVERLLGARPTVFDAVYLPVDTELIRTAVRLGCPVVHGHEMLLAQGAAAFRIWTGLEPPEPVMRRSLLDSLKVAAR